MDIESNTPFDHTVDHSQMDPRTDGVVVLKDAGHVLTFQPIKPLWVPQKKTPLMFGGTLSSAEGMDSVSIMYAIVRPKMPSRPTIHYGAWQKCAHVTYLKTDAPTLSFRFPVFAVDGEAELSPTIPTCLFVRVEVMSRVSTFLCGAVPPIPSTVATPPQPRVVAAIGVESPAVCDARWRVLVAESHVENARRRLRYAIPGKQFAEREISTEKDKLKVALDGLHSARNGAIGLDRLPVHMSPIRDQRSLRPPSPIDPPLSVGVGAGCRAGGEILPRSRGET